jgi:hypothetical protein
LSFFVWLEGTALSEWIRGTPSLWGFPFILYLHTLGLAMIAGLSTAVALGLIAMPIQVQRSPLFHLFPLMWIGLAVNAVSGSLLLIAYPAKALTNPVFYIKIAAIVIAVSIVQWLQRQLTGQSAARLVEQGGTAAWTANPGLLKRAAWTLIGLWVVATMTGRFLAYTHSILLASMGDFR